MKERERERESKSEKESIKENVVIQRKRQKACMTL